MVRLSSLLALIMGLSRALSARHPFREFANVFIHTGHDTHKTTRSNFEDGDRNLTSRRMIRQYSTVSHPQYQFDFLSPSEDASDDTPSPGAVVVLRDLNGAKLQTVLSQVCGGPLERAAMVDDVVVLHFIHFQAAERFHAYACSGQFVVCGRRIYFDPPEINIVPRDEAYERCTLNGARRTLKISRSVRSCECKLLYSRINLDELKTTFSVTGKIIAVQPMFCKMEVAFMIAYEEVLGAIRAKRLFDRNAELFKNFKEWELDFTRDPTDRPCFLA